MRMLKLHFGILNFFTEIRFFLSPFRAGAKKKRIYHIKKSALARQNGGPVMELVVSLSMKLRSSPGSAA